MVAGYRIERVLGTGGMGAVYLAANPTLPRHDALKVLSAELSRDPDFRARFIREADVASALDHPNIVAVYNRGQTENGELWIAMQYVDGTDAEAALRAGTMTAERAVRITAEVAKALDYAHRRDVVHRDVKPANFLLSGVIGPDERALLGDFGIARALGDVGLTATGSVLATVAYAAPEVLSGNRFDTRADIYSLGCTLFRLLTGANPFPGENGLAAVMMAHLQSPPPRVSSLLPALGAFDDVIACAMAKDPAARFSSAGEMAAAARAASRNSPWSPPAPAQRRPAIVTYPGAGNATSPWWRHDNPPGVPPVDSGRSRRRSAWLAGALAAAVVLAAGAVTAVTHARHGDPARSAADAGAGLAELPGSTAAPGPHQPDPSAGPAATDVAPARLRSILLTAAELPGGDTGEPLVLESDSGTLFNAADTIDAAQCVGAWAPAQQWTYADSGYTGVAGQVLRAMYQNVSEDGVIQAVLTFPSQGKAITSLQRQRDQWAICADKAVTMASAGEPAQAWDFGRPGITAGTTKIDIKLHDGTVVCQHGIGVRGNVLIDIRQCRPRGEGDVSALLNATANKVPRQ